MDPCIHGEDPLDQKNADGRTAFQLYIVDHNAILLCTIMLYAFTHACMCFRYAEVHRYMHPCTYMQLYSIKTLYNLYTYIDGNDFIFDPLNLTFMAGNINSVFSITINDDNLFEINETFDLNITYPSSTPLSVGNRTATIEILDNDRKH